MKRYALTETAKLIRQTLKTAFPDTKFSVRSKSYSGGSSIDVSWTDGPLSRDVNPLIKPFEGAGFDGMQDLKTYNPNSEFNGQPCEFSVDYVFATRHESEVLLQIAAYRVHKETKLPLLEVKSGCLRGGEMQIDFTYFPDEDVIATGKSARVKGGEWYSQVVYQIARNTSSVKPAAKPDLPVMVTDSYIASKVSEMIQ